MQPAGEPRAHREPRAQENAPSCTRQGNRPACAILDGNATESRGRDEHGMGCGTLRRAARLRGGVRRGARAARARRGRPARRGCGAPAHPRRGLRHGGAPGRARRDRPRHRRRLLARDAGEGARRPSRRHPRRGRCLRLAVRGRIRRGVLQRRVPLGARPGGAPQERGGRARRRRPARGRDGRPRQHRAHRGGLHPSPAQAQRRLLGTVLLPKGGGIPPPAGHRRLRGRADGGVRPPHPAPRREGGPAAVRRAILREEPEPVPRGRARRHPRRSGAGLRGRPLG